MFSQLIGMWFYSGLIYNGQPIPKPNPDLIIYYEFKSAGDNNLLYFRQGQSGQCQRQAEYRVEDNQIVQTITKVDESNSADCSADTDMQVGNKSIVPFRVQNDQLFLTVSLGEDELIYVWDRITN